MCLALVDTGSVVSIVQKKWLDGMGLQCTQLRALPQLSGITHNILPVLGTVYLDVHIGTRVITHLFAVVPDAYLDSDLLLGADLLKTAPITWDNQRKVILWDGFTYPVRILRPRPSNKRVRHIKVTKPPDPCNAHVRLKKKIVLPQYTTGMYPVQVNESPDSLLEFVAQVGDCQSCTALCIKVNESQEIFVPLVNNTKARITMKAGTLVGSYRKISEQDIGQYVSSCMKTKIQNNLVPESVDVKCQGNSREEKLQYLLTQKDFSHLSDNQQKQLHGMLTANHSIFILEDNELGKFKEVQAHIVVSDPTPVRTPNYRYPEKAKEIISLMLEEMEKKGVIESSTAAWLSPIVLVNKPDNSKRMCLDYRKVNTHLQVDIHPLPLLEEMVENAAGNHYYASLDMKDAYYQVELDEESRDLTTFSDGVSLYRFKRLPFGLSCSPAIFSRTMGNILAPLIKLGWVKNYLDDIVVWAP